MDEKRKGEIALAVLKYNLTQRPMLLNSNNVKRRLGNASKVTGVPIEELEELFRSIMQEVVEKAFSK